MKTSTIFLLTSLFFSGIISGFAQTTAEEPMRLSGPRVGVTGVTGNMAEYLEGHGLSPFMSQFGWQFETRYFQTESGYQGLIEFVPLLAGLESRQASVSANVLVGFRTPSGLEFGVGPNFSARGLFSYDPIVTTSLIYAVGHSFKVDEVNIPVNIAFSPSANGARITALVGFNIKRKNNSLKH